MLFKCLQGSDILTPHYPSTLANNHKFIMPWMGLISPKPHQWFHFCLWTTWGLCSPFPKVYCFLLQSVSQITHSLQQTPFVSMQMLRCPSAQLQPHLSSGCLTPPSSTYYLPRQHVTSPLRALPTVAFTCNSTKPRVYHIRETSWAASNPCSQLWLPPCCLLGGVQQLLLDFFQSSHSSRPSSSLTSSLKTC